MTFQSDIASDVQQSELGDVIYLYEIDLTDIGSNQILYITEAIDDDLTSIAFQGRTYYPIHMETDGWEVSGEGTLQRPTVRLSNVLLTFAGYVLDFEDLIGAKFKRKRTLKKYLDGEPESNWNAVFPEDIYIIQQKTQQTKLMVEFELAAYMDFEGIMIPKRQIVRDFCTHLYRFWDSGTQSFDPDSKATCPYNDDTAGGGYNYDRNGKYTPQASDDFCGKQLKDCEMRYAGIKAFGTNPIFSDTAPGSPSEGDYWLDKGQVPNMWKIYEGGIWVEVTPDPLPTRAFPGVGRFRG